MKEKNCEYLLKRTKKRLNKIIKQSDKQQLLLIELNEEIEAKKQELKKLYDYDKRQQLIAKKKLDNNIINDLEDSTKIIYYNVPRKKNQKIC